MRFINEKNPCANLIIPKKMDNLSICIQQAHPGSWLAAGISESNRLV